jgi:serine protease Do
MRTTLPCLALLWSMIVPGMLRAQQPESINLRRTIAVDVAERTKDAVVYISTRKIVSQRFNPTGHPMFDQFDFGQTRRFEAGSLGSGFLVHPSGLIVTNNHVVDRARQIEVELLDGRKLPVDLIATDPEADIAILKIESDKPLPVLELGDSSDLLVGEPTIAVGNPLGFSHTVSVGIVSALHRDLKDERNQVLLGDLIQTDAAINPGNSGGPLLNAYGQVIGINTAIRGDAQNIGFAIQVNKLRDMIPELLNPAQAAKIEMPIKLKETRRTSAPSKVDATIVNADDNTPIESIAGRKPRDIVDAYAILLSQRADEPFSIALSGGKQIEITPRAVPTPDAIVRAKERLGMTVEALSPMTAQKYGLIDEEGMLVTQVARNSIAARAGIQPGDVILQLGRYPVRSLDHFSTLMQHLPDSGNVRIGVARGQQRGFLMLQI